MERTNGQQPDCEIHFSNTNTSGGLKLSCSLSRNILEFRIPSATTTNSSSSSSNKYTNPIPQSASSQPQLPPTFTKHTLAFNLLHADPDEIVVQLVAMSSNNHSLPPLQPLIKHAQECVRQCLEIEKSAAANTSEDANVRYPLILKSAASSNQYSETDGIRAPSPPISLHPSHLSLQGEVMNTSNRNTSHHQQHHHHRQQTQLQQQLVSSSTASNNTKSFVSNKSINNHNYSMSAPNTPLRTTTNTNAMTIVDSGVSMLSSTNKSKEQGLQPQHHNQQLKRSGVRGGSISASSRIPPPMAFGHIRASSTSGSFFNNSGIGGAGVNVTHGAARIHNPLQLQRPPASAAAAANFLSTAKSFAPVSNLQSCFLDQVGWCVKVSMISSTSSSSSNNNENINNNTDAFLLAGSASLSTYSSNSSSHPHDVKVIIYFLDGVCLTVDTRQQTVMMQDRRRAPVIMTTNNTEEIVLNNDHLM